MNEFNSSRSVRLFSLLRIGMRVGLCCVCVRKFVKKKSNHKMFARYRRK